MHHGNLSFISTHGRPYELAPPYDILPMGFAPTAGGRIVNHLRPASFPDAISGDIWRRAVQLAENFLDLTSSCEGFSANFSPCLEALRQHIDEAGARIARLA